MKTNGSTIFKVQKNKEKIYNIENIKMYLSNYLFVLISFDSLLATGLLFILIEVLSKKSQKQ